MTGETSERFARLESHLAHLEHQVEALNDVVVEQGRALDRLARQVQLQVRAQESAELERVKANNPRPPHH